MIVKPGLAEHRFDFDKEFSAPVDWNNDAAHLRWLMGVAPLLRIDPQLIRKCFFLFKQDRIDLWEEVRQGRMSPTKALKFGAHSLIKFLESWTGMSCGREQMKETPKWHAVCDLMTKISEH